MEKLKIYTCCLTVLASLLGTCRLNAQVSSVIIPSNVSTGSLEKNLLFYADQRFQVTRQGPSIPIAPLFDGSFLPQTTSTAPTTANPLVILIENLPSAHTQSGAWIGWSTRNWRSTRFKIEGYDTYNGNNQWIELANVSGHSSRHFMTAMPQGNYTKLRYTFYEASSPEGRLQLSELFYIHPEAVQAYEGLMVKYDASGNVGIGTTEPQAKLAVNGTILATEVKVKTDIAVPDYVFEPDYELPALADIEIYVKEHRHLPEIPSAADIEKDGLNLAEMNLLLLKKVEELTLHLIELKKENEKQGEQIKTLMGQN
ncbi:hypothetical protein [Parapedobacter koreensis]|uniref:Uncharacterized protein n=1 Tax=Parapedobacter koreensis TaxID=332977 RepID=A0A1H7UFG2_9SPHI|nr:hypothetical protein [Parapedobacter koreensis]SEL95753.1 hypothetical protein SAMN05421740_11542 [Parapedobacter koreensis]